MYTRRCNQTQFIWTALSKEATALFHSKKETQSRTHSDHLHAEEGENQVQLNPERQGDHMHSEEGKHQDQLNAGSHGGYLHAEGRARGGTQGSTQH